MIHTINGLPAHVLLIHAIVVLTPLGALFTILSAVWPVARRKLGFISPLTCLIVLILTPITTSAGQWFKDKLQKEGLRSTTLEHHANLGHTFLWFAIGLFVLSAAVWWIGRQDDLAADPSVPAASGGHIATLTRTATAVRIPTGVRYAVMVVSVVVSVVTVIQLVRIGDSGAHSVYGGR